MRERERERGADGVIDCAGRIGTVSYRAAYCVANAVYGKDIFSSAVKYNLGFINFPRMGFEWFGEEEKIRK